MAKKDEVIKKQVAGLPAITKESIPIKKTLAKKTIVKKIITPKKPAIKKMPNNIALQQSLVDNFVNLQRVLTNLVIKFDELSLNITKLLQLFEISAKSFAEKYSGETGKEAQVDKEFLSKLDSLLDQNKTIAKGIMLMEEKIRNKALTAQKRTPAPYSQSIGGSPQPATGFRSNPLPRY